MANSLANRATIDRTLSLFRLSYSFFGSRSFSAASDSSQNPSAPSKKPKRKKKKNLFEVAQFLPNWGIGYHMAKTHWTGVSYEITKINLYKVFLSPFFLFFTELRQILPNYPQVLRGLRFFFFWLQDGRHGKAWGIVHKEGWCDFMFNVISVFRSMFILDCVCMTRICYKKLIIFFITLYLLHYGVTSKQSHLVIAQSSVRKTMVLVRVWNF